MAMKKNISKALAIAVMMSVFCGSAYAAEYVEKGTVDSTATNSQAIGSGSRVEAGANYSVAVGNNAIVYENSNNSVAVAYATVWSPQGTALGIGAMVARRSENSTAVGSNSCVYYDSNNSDAFGAYAEVEPNRSYAVALGSESKATENNTVSVGNAETNLKRKIVNVADGSIAEGSNEAVTGGQMYTMTNVAKGNYIAAGTDVAGNLTALDTQVKINADEIAKKADQTALDTETKERKDADDNLQKQIDAISGGSSAGLNELNNKINQTNDRVDRVGATAAALAGIHYQPMAKGQSQVAVGMGGYKGKKATALGLAYQISDRISGSVAGAANGSEHMFNVGFNYLFGQHSDKDIAQCAAVPGSVSLKEAELQSQVDSLKADNASMKAHIAKQDAEMAELKAMVKALAAK